MTPEQRWKQALGLRKRETRNGVRQWSSVYSPAQQPHLVRAINTWLQTHWRKRMRQQDKAGQLYIQEFKTASEGQRLQFWTPFKNSLWTWRKKAVWETVIITSGSVSFPGENKNIPNRLSLKATEINLTSILKEISKKRKKKKELYLPPRRYQKDKQ